MKLTTYSKKIHFLKYELWTELVHFKMCELNFELVDVESELSQHWLRWSLSYFIRNANVKGVLLCFFTFSSLVRV